MDEVAAFLRVVVDQHIIIFGPVADLRRGPLHALADNLLAVGAARAGENEEEAAALEGAFDFHVRYWLAVTPPVKQGLAMAKWIALLRGINVGGHNKLPMAALREVCAGLGWEGVRTFIQSGNVVFEA